MKTLIKSPLNYTGNKYRILQQILPLFPKKIDCMIDLFCGGATVGLNVDAAKVIFVDSNERVINLLIYLSQQSFEDFLTECENLISQYHLSFSYKYGYTFYREQCTNIKDNNGLKEYNTIGFYNLRDDYNALEDKTSDIANLMLYLLMVYGFNNDIRFNADGMFNLPVGKTDLNKMNVDKIRCYIERVNSMETEFICMSFLDEGFEKILETADFVYMDPPYLITDAVYNSGWNNDVEHKLLDFIESLIEKGIPFALSNILKKVDKVNEPLSYWLHKHKDTTIVYPIVYDYRSASYNKKTRDGHEQEVVICNKEYHNED